MKSFAMKGLTLVALAGGVALISTHGANSASAGTPAGAPRAERPVVSIAPTTVGVAASHYQAAINLPCTGTISTGAFPAPPKNSQLNVTRINCEMFSSTSTDFDSAFLDLFQGSNFVFAVALPLGSSSASQKAHLLNHAVDILVTSKQHLEAFTNVTTGTPSQAGCTISGTLYTLD
jgi:hypothetical protein